MRGAALLAAAAILAAACGGKDELRSTTVVAAADTADQVLEHLQHYITKDGVRQSLVEADTAYYYEAPRVFELRGVKVTFYDASGAQTSVLTSREGTYHVQTSDMQARGNVVVVSTDGRTLRTERLNYNQATNKLSTDLPFTFVGPTSSGSGNGFVSDPDFKDVTIQQGRGVEHGSGFVPPGQ
ncbi:MAG TPA: LPS export ABC transporter periplasmic protein LptC [Gemmatimonadales bacterium]|nr:LPS export ABC transporter periplasmic protein LptC [Gemmatimonadales bacterium]